MDYESLALDLDELVRRMREDPLFPWRKGDDVLIARINESSRAVGVAEPVGFDFDRERGIARFAICSPDQKIPSFSACSIWCVPKRRMLPNGDLCFDYHAAPLKERSEYAAILARWIHFVRSAPCVPGRIESRFPEPKVVLSERADAVRTLLMESTPVGMPLKEIARRLGPEIAIDEYGMKRVRKELNAAGCPISNRRGIGYFMETSVPEGAP